MPGLTTPASAGGIGAQAHATSVATAAITEGNGGGRWVTIKQDGKVLFTKSFFPRTRYILADQPPRPVRPTFEKVPNASLHQENKRCHDYMEWLEKHLEDQERGVVSAEMARVEDRNKAADQLNAVRKEFKEKLNAVVTENVAAIKQDISIKRREVEVRIDSLKKRKEDLKASAARLARTEEKSKTYKDLCNAVADVADKIDKAERGRQNLTARKNTPQSAFDKWEQQYCKPISKLADLIRETDTKRQENDRECAEQSAAVRAQEAQAAALLLQRQQEQALLEDEKQHFLAEKQEWRFKQGKELAATEMKDAMEVFLQEKIEQIKPDMLAEAKHSNWMLQKQDRKAREARAVACAKGEGKLEGHRRGYEEGYAQGKLEEDQRAYSIGMVDAQREHQLRLIEAKRESRDEGYEAGHEAGYEAGANKNCDESHTIGYEKGRNAGYSQGHQKGHAKGYNEGLAEGRRLVGQDSYDTAYQEGYGKGQDAGLIEGKRLGNAAEWSKGYDDGHAGGVADARQSNSEAEKALKEAEWNKGWAAGYKAKRTGDTDRLKEEFDRGVAERGFAPRLTREHDAGKDEGYSNG